MTAFALVDATILAGSADLSGNSNEVGLETEADVLDATTFRSQGWRQRKAGHRSGSFSVKGLFEAGSLSLPDDSLFANLSRSSVLPVTVSPVSPAVGGVAYLLAAQQGSYKWGDQAGQLLPFEAAAQSAGMIARGAYAATGAKAVSGNGAGVNLGGVPAGSKLVAALHVVSVAGGAAPSITVRVESDDSQAFPSPTTRGTFTAATAVGGQWLEIAAPALTETWWRVSWTITGTAPSFLIHAAFGIAAK